MRRCSGCGLRIWLLATWRELRAVRLKARPDRRDHVAYGITNSFSARLVAHQAPHPVRIPTCLTRFHALAGRAHCRSQHFVERGTAVADRVDDRRIGRLRVATWPAWGWPERVILIPSDSATARPVIWAAIRSQRHRGRGSLLFVGWLYRHSGLVELALELTRVIEIRDSRSSSSETET